MTQVDKQLSVSQTQGLDHPSLCTRGQNHHVGCKNGTLLGIWTFSKKRKITQILLTQWAFPQDDRSGSDFVMNIESLDLSVLQTANLWHEWKTALPLVRGFKLWTRNHILSEHPQSMCPVELKWHLGLQRWVMTGSHGWMTVESPA